MTAKLLLTFALTALPLFLLAQKGKGGGSSGAGGTPAASPSPSGTPTTPASQSGASQIEQGYHYILPAYNFMKYGRTDSVIRTSTPTAAKPDHITVMRLIYYRHITPGKPNCNNCVDPQAVIDTVLMHADTTCIPSDAAHTLPVCTNLIYYDAITTRVYVDSLDRYYPAKRHVGITQGDSGLLSIGLYEDYISDSLAQAASGARRQHTLRSVAAVPAAPFMGLFKIFAGPASRGPQKAGTGPHPITVYQKKFYGKTDTIHRAILLGPQDLISNLSLRVNPKIAFDDITYYIRLHYCVFQTGALTIPYKYNFGYKQKLPNGGGQDTIPNYLNVNINVSLAAGLRYGRTRFYYDPTKTYNGLATFFGVFAGPTQIQLSSTNTFSGSSKTSNQLGISTGVCAMMELKNINFGVFGGYDFPVTTAGADWFYSNKIWLGFGIGVNLAMFTSGTHQAL